MNKKDIKQFNQKGQPHGYWEVYFPNGSLGYKGFYNNGKPVGYSEYSSYLTKKLSCKKYYI